MNNKLLATVTITLAITIGCPQVTPASILPSPVEDLLKVKTASAMSSMDAFVATTLESNKADVTSFKDVNTDHWAYSSIMSAVKNGYVVGYSDGTFKPNAEVTRAEFAAIISRASTLKENAGASNFSDVSATNWAYSAINSATAKGFFGNADYGSKLNPTQAMTRGEIASWLANGLMTANEEFKNVYDDLSNTLLPFVETYNEGFAEEDVGNIAMMAGTKIMNGMTDGSFQPNKTITRAEVVALLTNYLNAEGKSPSSYLWVTELAEVGRDGHNYTSQGATWTIRSKKEWPLHGIMNKDFDMSHNGISYGTLQLHKSIAIDTTKVGKENESIYTKMFYGSPNVVESVIRAYNLVTMDLTKDVGTTTLAASLVNGVTGSTVYSADNKHYNIPTFPTDGTFKNLLKSGTKKTLWVTTGYSNGAEKVIRRTSEEISSFRFN